MYDNTPVCTSCGGACCKNMPGIAFPSDFGLPSIEGEQKLKDAFLSGKWTMEVYVGNPFLFYTRIVRPAVKGYENILISGSRIDAMKGVYSVGVCSLLMENGCPLETNMRPHQCQFTEPQETRPCPYHGLSDIRKEAASLWFPFQALLESIAPIADWK